MENLIKFYLDSIFNDEIRHIFSKSSCIENYKNSEISEWLTIENEFKKLLPYGNLNNFYIEVNDSGSTFIKKLFNEYANEDTFVVGFIEHQIIQVNTNKTAHKLNLDWNIIQSFDVNTIINKFEQSNCKRLLIYGTGIFKSQIVPQSFYIKLKEKLVEKHIDHVMILDDVQGMFIVPRDYSIFDHVIFSCHALVPNYNLGILLSKQHKNFGYTDRKALEGFLNILKIFLEKKDKILLFNLMLKQYFAEEIFNNIFNIPVYSTLNIFYINFNDEIIKNLLSKYREELFNMGRIEVGDTSILIRASFLLSLDSEQVIEELKKLKFLLQKCIKLKDRLQ